jgi:methyl-accepting chemotaxis protein
MKGDKMWKKFLGWKLKSKLFTMTGVSIGFFLIYALISNATLSRLKVNGPVYAQIVQGKDLVADILPPPEYVIESYLVCLQMLGAKDAAEQKQLADRITALKSDYDTRHDFWVKDLPDGKMKQIMIEDSYKPAIEFYKIVQGEYIPAIQSGDKVKATELAFGRLRSVYEQHRAAIDQVVEMANTSGSQTEKEAAALVTSRSIWLWVTAGAGIALALALAWMIQNSIVESLIQTTETLSAGADIVASAARQLSDSSQSLSSGATQQAASIEETSSALEEMGGMTDRNVKNTSAASALAQQAHEAIGKSVGEMQGLQEALEKARKVSGEMNESMQAIKSSSDSIRQIMSTIDEIAFQTNILALNAAVEAARAGEAGAGFAVVANEVRTLAQRCSKASSETSGIIEESIRRSETGLRINATVMSSLEDIHGKSRTVDDDLHVVLEKSDEMAKVVVEIAQASSEQNLGTHEINKSIDEIDKVTQSCAANAEQAAAAAEELNGESHELKNAVDILSGLIHGQMGELMTNSSWKVSPVASTAAAASKLVKADKSAVREKSKRALSASTEAVDHVVEN